LSDSDAHMVEGSDISLDQLIDKQEHSLLRDNARAAAGANARYFGLQPYSDESARGRLGYYVGIGRLPEAPGRIVRVSARRFGKDDGKFAIDYVGTYAVCAADPEVSRHLDRCLTVYPDEAPVEVHDDAAWSPLIALAYVRALHTLIQRHLRRGFIAREERLRGRVRGRVDVSRYVGQSLARGHLEIVPCRFQALEQDTLENRILRTALVGAGKLLGQATGTNLREPTALWRSWARQAEAALTGASVARIEPRDFQAARKTGSFRHYAHPLALARAVLTRVGFDPNGAGESKSATVWLVPFRLATAELFERYVEACLRSALRKDDTMWAGYDDNNLGAAFKIRPDFLVRSGDVRLIFDAKYKDLARQRPSSADDEENAFRQDTYQVLSYSQHKSVQNWWPDRTGKPLPPSMVVLCYPNWLQPSEHHNANVVGNTNGDLIAEIVQRGKAFASGQENAAQSQPTHVKVFDDFAVPVARLGFAVPAIRPKLTEVPPSTHKP